MSSDSSKSEAKTALRVWLDVPTSRGEMISYLEANTFGIGELITQRKILRVPEHQRDFAWTKDDVERFIDDIIGAKERNAADYFIGLVVLLGPRDNAWYILDGQQRIATTIMIYSAIRQWLSARSYNDDAHQIESEFIGVRQLGGAYSPRLTLNIVNQQPFLNFVISKTPTEELESEGQQYSKHSSNRRLLDAALTCQTLIAEYAARDSSNKEEQAAKLFALSLYIESKVQAVCLDVSSEANAYILFESLNDRGADLSALDLVKNYTFSLMAESTTDEVKRNWMQMASQIEDKDADDFLKVFWTSQFGRIQKVNLFSRIRQEYAGTEGGVRLSSELMQAAEKFVAVEDSSHEIWSLYGPICKMRIETLEMLGSRQVRPLILSAIYKFDPTEMEIFLWSLIVLTVRYQVVSKRRPGGLEIACARVAPMIHSGKIHTAEEAWSDLISIVPTDEEFYYDFLKFAEPKASRAAYFLSRLEEVARENQTDQSDLDASPYLGASPHFIFPRKPNQSWEHILHEDPAILDDQWLYSLGNRCLLEDERMNWEISGLPFRKKVEEYYAPSRFLLTKAVAVYENWNQTSIVDRQMKLATLATHAWPLQIG